VSDQGDLFDSDESERRAEVGMQRAIDADRVQQWREDASAWLDAQPSGREVTSDDLVAEVGYLPDEGPNRVNAVGAFFSAQARKGNLVFAGRMRRSKRIGRHVGTQRVWRIP
jgi:hypothetical protein